MLLRSNLGFAALSLLALPSAAADVIVVDDSGGAGVDFTSLGAATAAAQDGDVVLVRHGTYSGDVVVQAKSLVIEADSGATVSYTGRFVIQDLAPGQFAVWSGFDVTPPAGGQFGALDVLSCAGPVWIQDVSFSAPAFHNIPQMVSVDASSAVVLIRCNVSGGSFPFETNPGIRGTDSAVSLFDCSITGGQGFGGLGGPFAGGEGVILDGGSLFALSSAIQGGPGTPIGSPFGGCTGVSGDGGVGLRLLGASPSARLYDTVLAGGAPGALLAPGTCTQGLPGAPSVVEAGTLDASLWAERHFVVTTPVRADESVGVTIQAQPGDLAWLVFSTSTLVQTIAPVVGPLAVGSPVIVPLGVLATGQAAFSVATFVPPGADAQVYFAQPLFVDALGAATLGDPAHVVELHPSL